MPLLRFPVRKRRPLLGDVSDVARPIRTVVTVRNVVACDIDDFTDDDLDGRVELLFGVTVEGPSSLHRPLRRAGEPPATRSL